MNRVLVFGPTKYDKLDFVRRLFKIGEISKEQISGGDGGGKQSGVVISDLELHTKYYKATVTVFIDEPETNTVAKYVEWLEELASDEMKELRDEVQLLVVLFPPSDPAYEEITSAPLNRLNALLDSEHCATHTESLQWDGELLATSTADPNLSNEARNTLECVVWREIELLDGDGEQAAAKSRLTTSKEDDGSEKELRQFEHDLARLRNARARRSGVADGDGNEGLSAEERQLVETVLARVIGTER